MKKAYLDNASTTAIRPEVIEEMTAVMSQNFGNSSSTHSYGRGAKVLLETARKTIASLIGAEAREIIFTSGGTEADNWVIRSAVKDLGVKRIITSKIEHHAVLNTVKVLETEFDINVEYIAVAQNGEVDLNQLETLLADKTPTLVSLMHVNNETGVVLDIDRVGKMCKEYGALFHSDTVQSIGKTEFDLNNTPIDFIVASAHKFHGPKGVGFTFVRKNTPLHAMIYGGEQEKGMRAGTEAIHQIVGMAKALELSYKHLNEEREQITALKQYLLERLDVKFPGYIVNGDGAELFYNLVNVMLPLSDEKTGMILFHLDMKGIAVSRGSACQSGSVKPSHVLKEMLTDEDVKKPSLRISLSHYNTKEDIDLLIDALKTV
ncbi:cysteine desulfurase family protein [Flavobacterium rakeshii]|uniref:cysteine desulfurase family protein n=1 Tax=Flavobacterium rakeshii TaxID=1038845 RepID=UPI002E7AB63E|nr:cysteine desulfurase family protein [Flavobacterium rakeshii]MEE1898724.1 cysteine desulfurase family protein [Flavobacterium rakeshii]